MPGRYPIVADAEAMVEAYRLLVDDVDIDVVTFQTMSLDQEATIRMLGAEVLPRLRD